MAEKYKRMCDEDIKKLISARIENSDKFLVKFYRRDQVWLAVQKTAHLEEFSLDQLRVKWNYLFKKYKELLAPPTGVSTEDGVDTAENWKWFSDMHKFASGQHVIHPPLIGSSIPGCSVYNPMNSFGITPQHRDNRETAEIAGDSISSLSADSAPSTSNGSSSSRGCMRPGKHNSMKRKTMLEMYEKDSKRLKKEGKCILNFLSAYAQKEGIAFQQPSSSSESE